jgi:hypothetical protein
LVKKTCDNPNQGLSEKHWYFSLNVRKIKLAQVSAWDRIVLQAPSSGVLRTGFRNAGRVRDSVGSQAKPGNQIGLEFSEKCQNKFRFMVRLNRQLRRTRNLAESANLSARS